MIKKILKKIIRSAKKHKIITAISLFVIISLSYLFFSSFSKSKSQTLYYSIADVKKGTLIVSTQGSGQVSAKIQQDIKPKVSGDIISIFVKSGQEVKAGAVMAQIDTTDAQKNLKNAKTDLETAKLELEKLEQPVDELTMLQAENSLYQAQQTLAKSKDDLEKTYEDGYNSVANAFLNLPTIMTGLENILFSQTIDNKQENMSWYINQTTYQNNDREKAIFYQNNVYDSFNKAKTAFSKNFDDYKLISRFSEKSKIEDIINQTYETSKLISDVVKSTNNYIDFVQNVLQQQKTSIPTTVQTHQTSLDSYTGTSNSILTSLLSSKRSIIDSKQAVINGGQSVKEKTLSLEKTKSGADPLGIRAKKISVSQKEDALLTAQQAFNDCFVKIPFDGVIAKISIKKGDAVSPGTSIGTLITNQKIAEISLNEIDIAKIKAGQKATISFDAVEDLSTTGEVQEVDSIGSVSQGVVNYSVKISFDTQDERIKPGMSLSASIITDVKQNVLTVPNSAIKQQGNQNYIQIINQKEQDLSSGNNISLKFPPQNQIVETGISNDESTEIISGLNEGDKIIVQTINKTSSSQTQQNSGLRIPGITTGGFQGGVNNNRR